MSSYSSTESVDPEAIKASRDSSFSLAKADSKTAGVGVRARVSVSAVQTAESNPKSDASGYLVSCSTSSGQKGDADVLHPNVDSSVLSSSMSSSSIGGIES